MFRLTQKCLDILDLLEYGWDRVFNDSSTNGWTIGKTRKFIALWMTKEEGVKRWFLSIVPDNPLRKLCDMNTCIPYNWIQVNLTPDQYIKFNEWIVWQGQSKYWVWSGDVIRFLNLNSL